MTRVLIADDSPTCRSLLASILGASGMTVVGEARDGEEAVSMTRGLRPEVVIMDVNMPMLDGFEATRRIMVETPTPIVVVSGCVDTRDVVVTMRALDAGALVAVPKPRGPGAPTFAEEARAFADTVRLMAQVKVVRRFAARHRPQVTPVPREDARPTVIAVGASTGGPGALKRLLSALPAALPPILVVQHIAAGFVDGFAAWLQSAAGRPVEVARHGATLHRGTVYVAPDGAHLGVARGAVELSEAPPIGGFRPSATHLFQSVARASGSAVVAVVLTGMGHDGLDGLRAVREAGGRVFAQDAESCVVFGMPGAAVDAGLAEAVLPPEAIGRRIAQLVT
ncbi:MAG: hypothetical protein AMXMBFR64_55210 [Myxococcales bacterium]